MRRRAVVLSLTVLTASCHRSQAAPKDNAPVSVSADSATTSAEAPLDSGDPAVLSRFAETSAQIEPQLAVSSESTLALAWMGVRPEKPTLIGARISRDLGATWGAVEAVVAPEGRFASDPVIGVAARGDVFLAWLGFRPDVSGGDPRDTHVYVAHVGPSSTSLSAPLEITDRMRRGTVVDKPSLAMTSAGTALVTWKYVNEGGNGIGIARGDAEGNWTPGKVIERVGLQAWLPSVCASAHGDRVWVAYLDGEAGVRVRASDDGAASWSPSRAATVSLAEEKPRLAIDTPVCSGDGDDVVVAYGRTREPRDDARSPGLDAILIARSFDGGRTYDWRRTIEMGDSVAMHPQVVREPDGAIDVAYYTMPTSADAGDATGALRYLRIAERGGGVVAPRVAHDHVKIARERKSPYWPGDYFGLAWREGKLYFASIDAGGDVSHVELTSVAVK
jgi:hypothetical protein